MNNTIRTSECRVGGQQYYHASKKLVAAVTDKFIETANDSPGDSLIGEQINYLIWKLRCFCELNNDTDFKADPYEGLKGLTKLAGGLKNQEYKEKALDSLIDALERIRGDLSVGEKLAGSLLEYAQILLKNWSDILNIQSNNTHLHVKMIIAIGDVADLYIRYVHYERESVVGGSIVGGVNSEFKGELQEMVKKFESLYPELVDNPEVIAAIEYTKSVLIILKSNSNTLKDIAKKLDELFKAKADQKIYETVGRSLYSLYENLEQDKVSNWFSKAFLLKSLAAKAIYQKTNVVPGTYQTYDSELYHYNLFLHHVEKPNGSWQSISIAINLIGKMALITSSMRVTKGLIEALERENKRLNSYRPYQIYLQTLITNELIKISTQLPLSLKNDLSCEKNEKELRRLARNILIFIADQPSGVKAATIAKNFFLSLKLLKPEKKFVTLGFDNTKKLNWLNEEGEYAYTPKVHTPYSKPLRNPFEEQHDPMASAHQIVDLTSCIHKSSIHSKLQPASEVTNIINWLISLPSLPELPPPIDPVRNSIQFPIYQIRNGETV